MTSLTSTKPKPLNALDIPAQFIFDCAVGLEDWNELAKRYGIEPVQWQALQNWDPFRTEVAAKRAELQKAGVQFRIKAGIYADDLMNEVYKRMMGEEVSTLQKLEGLKYFTKVAGLEPSPTQGAGAGGVGFSINISIPGAASPMTIDAQATEKSGTAPMFSISTPDPVPEWTKGKAIETMDIST